MRYTYASDFADFRRAQRTLVRSSAGRRFRFHFLMWGLALVGVALLLAFSLAPRPSHLWIGTLEAGLVGGCLGGGVVSVLLRPWQMRRAYRGMRHGPRKDALIYLEVEGGVLRSGYEGTSEGSFQRPAIQDSAEDEEILLLFLSKRLFLYLPKRKLPAEAIAEVHTWLARPIGV